MSKAAKLFDISGKAAVVTGCARGLGAAILHGLADAGARVAGGDVLDPYDPLPAGARFLRTDVSRQDEVEALVGEAVREFGRLDILVANAAIGGGARAEDETAAGWDQVLDINAKGAFLCDRAAARYMKDHGGGSIVNLASILAFLGHPMCLSYTASKGAVAQMTRTMAIEWAKYGIRVNAIAPGFFRTPLNEGVYKKDEYMKPFLDKIPLGRFGEPEEIVGTVIYLASDASRFMTGSVVVIDGGELAAGGLTDAIIPFIYDAL